MSRYTIFQTSWGWFAFVSGPRGLLATYLPEKSKTHLLARVRRAWPDAAEDAAALPELQSAIRDFFNGRDIAAARSCDPACFDVPLDLEAMTPFRRKITLACRRIPRGQTLSYGELAKRCGKPRAARAVGTVMAKNPLCLLVPCHRVVGSNGSLGGFSGPDGLALKQRLLDLEEAVI